MEANNDDAESRILKLASVSNVDRKRHIKNKTTPQVEVTVPEDVCIATRHLGRNGTLVSDVSSTVQAAETPHVTIAYSKSTRKTHIDVRGKVNGEANTLSTGDGCGNMSTQNFVGSDIRIRKLTPVECERLQGYPDNHTKYGALPEGKVYEMSNTQRYKQCGNGVSSPVSEHILSTLLPEGDIRLMSLFSGIGGTELNLPERFKVVGHCEFDKHASAVLKYLYPDIPNLHDVTKLVKREDVPEFDLLTFGFPCQTFSMAGLRKGFDGDRGNLIYHVFDIIKKYKPKYLLGENVKGLLSHNKGATFEAIMQGLSECGYDVDFELVNSKHFGLAQNRERVFIFGKRKD